MTGSFLFVHQAESAGCDVTSSVSGRYGSGDHYHCEIKIRFEDGFAEPVCEYSEDTQLLTIEFGGNLEADAMAETLRFVADAIDAGR